MQVKSFLKGFAIKVAPWIITVWALNFAFDKIDWSKLLTHIGEVHLAWVLAAIACTCASYLIRSWRWQSLFPERTFQFFNAAKVLILGFFMNNILPARAGEFVRAHMGARLANQKRTLVLASIASERLVDGLTISLMFVLFAQSLGDSKRSHEFLIVAWLFAGAGVAVLFVLFLRNFVFRAADRLLGSHSSKSAHYALDRLKVFINGLTPLTTLSKLPRIVSLSCAVWLVELLVYKCIGYAFGVELTWAQCVLFLVAVNYASLVPAAPGGLGVIEAVGKAALVSLSIDDEHALAMVIMQHAIQYLVVGIPGLVIMFSWKRLIAQVRKEASEETDEQSA